jgi:hypothetical protein
MANEDVQVKFGASTEEMESGIAVIKERMEGLSESFKTLAEVAGIALSVEGLKSYIEAMADLGLQTERSKAILGISAEQVGVLGGVAKLTGTSVGGMENAIERMSLNIQKSTRDAFNPAAEGLKALGLSAKELIGLPADQYFLRLSDAVSKFAPSLNLTNAVMAVGGRGVAQLLPLLQLGSEHFREMEAAIKATGATLNDAQAGAFAATHERLTLMGMSLQGLGIKIFSVLKPAIDAAAESTTKWLQSFTADDIRDAANTVGNALITIAQQVAEFFVRAGFSIDILKGKFHDLMPSLEVTLTGVAAAAYRAGEDIEKPLKDVLARIRAEWDKPITFGGSEGGDPAAKMQAQLDEIAAAAAAAREKLDAAIPKSGTMAAAVQSFIALQNEVAGYASALGKAAPAISMGGKDAVSARISELQNVIKLQDEAFRQTQERLNSEAKVGQITETQKTQALLAALDARYKAQFVALGEEEEIGGLSKEQHQKILNEKLQLDQKYEADRQKIRDQGMQAEFKAWQSSLDHMASAFNSQLQGLLNKTETWSQAMAKIATNLATQMIETLEKVAIINPLANALKEVPAPTEFLQSILKAIMASVGQVFAGASAFFAPLLGPGAPAAAAAVSTGVEATAKGIASLDVGTDYVVKGGLALIHEGEQIRPAETSGPWTGGGGGMTVNFNLSAIDTQTGYAFMLKQLPAFARSLQTHIGNNPSVQPA